MQDTYEQLVAKRRASQGQQPPARTSSLGEFDPDDEIYQEELKKTPAGKQLWRETWRQKQLSAVEEEFKRKDLSESAKKSLTILRDYIKSPDYGKLPVKHGEEIKYVNEDGMLVSGGSDRARSFAEGFANSLPQLLDLPAALLQKLGVHKGADEAREILRQGQAAVTEKLDARTPEGEAAALKFIGGLANPATLKGYGKIAEVSGKVMAKGAGAVGLKGVQELITTGQQSANILERAETNVMTGLPLNAAQVFGQMPENMSKEDKLKQLAFGVIADAVGGAAFMQKPGGVKLSGEVEVPKGKVDVQPTSKDVEGILKKLEGVKAETAVKQAAAEEEKVYNSNARTMAAAEWQAANMGKKWGDLDKEQRKTIVEEWKKNKPIEWFRERVNAQQAEAQAPALPTEVVQNSTPIESRSDVATVIAGAKAANPSQSGGITPAAIDAIVADAIAAKATPAPELPVSAAPKELSMVEQLAAFQAKKATTRAPLETANDMTDLARRGSDPETVLREVQAGNVEYVPTISDLEKARSVIDAYRYTSMAQQRNAEWIAKTKEALNTIKSAALINKEAPELLNMQPQTYSSLMDHEVLDNATVVSNKILEAENAIAAQMARKQGANQQPEQVQSVEPPVAAAIPEPAVVAAVSEPVITPAVPEAVAPPAPTLTTRAELEALEDKLLSKLTAFEKQWQKANPTKSLREIKDWDNPEYKEARRRFGEVSTQLESMPDESLDTSMPENFAQPDALAGLTIRQGPVVDFTAPPATKVIPTRKPDITPAQFDIKEARTPRKLSDEKLNTAIDAVQARIDGVDKEADKQYMKILENLIEEQANRAVNQQMRGQANMPPGVGGAAVGFTYGVVTTDPNDPDANSRVLMWTLAGAAAGYGAGKFAKQQQVKSMVESKMFNLFPGQAALKAEQATVRSIEDKVEVKQPFTAMLRNFYNGSVRRIANFENLVGKLPLQVMEPLRNSTVKLAEHFNRSIARTEAWMHQAVVVDGPDGEPLYIGPTYLGSDVMPAQHILASVNGDKKGLSELMIALSSLELQAQGKMNTPFDEVYATMVVRNAPPEYIQAAREFRKFNLAMLKVMQLSGRINETTFNNLSQEEWYTPLYRVVEGGGTRNIRDLQRNRLSVRDPLKARKGGSIGLDVIDPVDQTLTLLPYVLRHHEYSQWVQSTLDLLRAQPPAVQRKLIKRVKSSDSETIKNIELQAKELRDSYDMSPEEIERLMVFKDQGDNARGGGGFITHWEDGVLSTYKVDDVIFDTAKSLLPFERDIINNALFKGARATTRVATKGVVLNPIFVAKQFLIDTLEAGVTTKYGFIPVLDSVRGWWSIASRSPEYLRAVDMGGLGAIQSLPYQNAESARKAFAAEGNSALAVSWNHMKELHPIEAYKALALPIAEASRMGEFLRARGHGASTLEGVFAAREIGFNVSMEGSFTAIRALHQLTMFTRPGIQAMDALARAAARNPARFLAANLAYIAIPSAALWWAYKDDKEIQKFRRTQVGKNYWFIRDFGGDVMRIRKPHILGQVFGTAVEEALDQADDKNPQTRELMRALYKDAAVNMLPLFGSIPLSIISGKDFSDLGDMRDITPQGDQDLERKYQGRDRASLPARIISDATFNAVTPAQTEYLINQISTTVGADFVQGATLAQDYMAHNYVPAKYELPIIRSVYANKRGQGENVYSFYQNLDEVEKRVKTLNHLMQPGELARNPGAYTSYYNENLRYIIMADTYSAARTDIANYRRLLEDLKKMKHLVSQKTLDSTEQMYLKLIDERARAANLMFDTVK